MGLVGRFWSGRHHRVVQGISLVTLLWTDGQAMLPCDYRLADPAVSQTKNDLFRAMLCLAKDREMTPDCVLFDTWYSGLENLKAVRALEWRFLTRVRCNRRVNPDRTGNRSISEVNISESGTVVHLEGFGMVKAFRIVADDDDTEHWITDELTMETPRREELAGQARKIEQYHRGIKQHCHVDRCQVWMRRAQATRIGLAIRAFVRLEWHRLRTGISWFEAKTRIVREAVRAYLINPIDRLSEMSTA